MMKRLLMMGLLAGGLTLSVAAQDFSPAADLKVGPRDVLEVQVVQDEKLNTRATVSEEGQITISGVGRVPVSGLTTREIEARLKSVLEARLLRVADVSVEVVQFGNKPISVVGAVTHPGSISTGGSMTLIQALTYAGGLAPGYGKTLYVIRTASNGLSEQLPIDIDDLMVKGDPDLNIPLAPNDLVNVQLEAPVTVFLLGEVMHPGKVELKRTPAPSLLMAIAAAGGPTDRANSTAVIKRAATAQTQRFNFRRISEGDAPDIPLQDGDTITVKESLF